MLIGNLLKYQDLLFLRAGKTSFILLNIVCFLQDLFTKSCKLKMENLASGISLTLQPWFPHLFRHGNRELQAVLGLRLR